MNGQNLQDFLLKNNMAEKGEYSECHFTTSCSVLAYIKIK